MCNAGNQYTKCQQDFHCNLATSRCEWNIPATYVDAGCNGNGGVDLTVGVSCSDGVTTHTPVCNRGSATMAASAASPKTIEVSIANGVGVFNPCNQAGAPVVCSRTLTAPLAAGACIDITGCDTAQGNRFFTVNPNHLVAECGWSGGAGGGCGNNGAGERGNGGACPEMCGTPPTEPPTAERWGITYDCVDYE